MIPLLFCKARNPGYTRKNGTYVKPFDDSRRAARPSTKWQPVPGGANGLQKPLEPPDDLPACATPHPKPDDDGKPKMIRYPSSPTDAKTWESTTDAAVFTPGSATPPVLNGVPVEPWSDRPDTEEDWDYVDGQNEDLIEAPIKLAPGKRAASGVIVQETDGRVWIISPTNQYGGVMHTFPKGGVEEGLSYQSNAIKEAFEESGLKVEIDSHAIDIERSTSVARYYFAHRVGGSPSDMGWESQAVRLVPLAQLGDYLNRPEDREILDFLRNRPATAPLQG